jgi:L-alanine-DL-glutamate epimerase-like enolase superfamily enzyme
VRSLKRCANGFTGSVKRVRIARVDVFAYDLRYAHGEYVMSGGRTVTSLPSTLVRVTTDSGLTGWGETCPLGPAYLEAHAGGARAALGVLAPALLGADPGNLGAVWTAMDAALRGHGYAKAALDIACLDVLGRALGVPLSTLLGGVRSPDFPLYVAIPLGPAAAMVEHVRERRAEGVRHFQLKLGADPREDAARVRAVLEEDLDALVADANGGWRLQDAVIAARALEGLEGVLFEQPCPTLEECLVVRERTTLPMVLDEVITDAGALIRAYGAMEAVNLKLGRVGGLSKARLLRDLGAELGLRFTIEDSWGGDVTTAAVSHLAASTAPDHLLMASFMNDWTLDHVAGYEPRSAGGRGAAPTGPGLGVEVDVERLGEPIESAVWSP